MCDTAKKIFSSITVEPVVFLTFAGLLNFQLVRDTGVLQVICSQWYLPDNPRLNCSNLSATPDLEDKIQQKATLWILMMAGAAIIPAMISDIIMGAWGDKNGRKASMLLGIAGTMASIVPVIALFTFQWLPLHFVIGCNLISGVTGSAAIVLISSYAFLADTITDKNILTIRMGILAVCLAAGQTVGSYSAGKLVNTISLPRAALVPAFFQTASFFYCWFFVPNIIPPRAEKVDKSYGSESDLEGLISVKSRFSSCCRLCFVAKDLLKEVFHTFTKPRKGYRRCFLLIGTLVFFISTLTDFHAAVMTLFTYHRPLLWTPNQLGTWKAVDNTLGLIGNLVGVLLSKRWLHLKDSTLVLMGLITCSAHHIIIGLSTTTWMVYAAACVGMLCNLVPPTISSFITHYIDSNEVGKVFSGFAVAAEVALVTAVLSFNGIYSATLSFFPGFVFMCMASLIWVAISFMTWVYWKAKTEEPVSVNETNLTDKIVID